jgi:NTE family protein
MGWLVTFGLLVNLVGDHVATKWHSVLNPWWHAVEHRMHYQRTPLMATAGAPGYRLSDLFSAKPDDDSLFVVLAFSGGGTRAAALSYGVLEELKQWKTPDGSSRLIDHVGLVTSISGGTTTALYWASHGTDGLGGLASEYLSNDGWDLQNDLGVPPESAIQRLNSPYFGPSDYAAELWAEHLFHHPQATSLARWAQRSPAKPITFGDLQKSTARPFFLVNATDVATGLQFSFIQEQFDALCANLSEVSISRAMAASGAFPVILSPITFENHRSPIAAEVERCPWTYHAPAWATRLANDGTSSMESLWARNLLQPDKNGKLSYMHLVDGGVADNVGLRPILLALDQPDVPWSFIPQLESKRIKRLAIIVVNAATQDENAVYARENAPGLIQSVLLVSGTPLDRMTAETRNQLRNRVAELRRVYPGVMSLEVSAENDVSEAERAFFNKMPTTYHLPAADAKKIASMGGEILRCAPGFQSLVAPEATRPAFVRAGQMQTSNPCGPK